jgi:transposase
MAQKALSMRKIKEVLRLRYDLGLLQNEIARSCSIGQSSVHRYLERASAAGLSWPLPEDCDDRRLNELLFPAGPAGGSPPALGPVDFANIHRQLQSHKYVTLQLLWKEYRQSQPNSAGPNSADQIVFRQSRASCKQHAHESSWSK